MSAVWFLAGLWVGATAGVLIMGVLSANAEADDRREVEPA